MAASGDIPFPDGWERRYDKTAQRHYYINHIGRITQWDDPRLTHPTIWTRERTDMVEHLRAIFKNAKTDVLRGALLETRFVESDAVNHLVSLGHVKTSVAVGPSVTNCAHSDGGVGGGGGGSSTAVSPKPAAQQQSSINTTYQTVHFEQQSGPEYATVKRSPKSPRSPAGGTTTSSSAAMSPRGPPSRAGSTKTRHHQQQHRGENAAEGVDHFTIMHMKALFPESTEDVLIDVLNQCGGNVDLASRELVNMGYGGRQKADTRIAESALKAADVEKLKKQREKQERDNHLLQLKREFESFLNTDIADVFSQNKFDLYETRTALRLREADVKLQSLSSSAKSAESSAITSPAVTIQVSQDTAEGFKEAEERRRASLSAIVPAANADQKAVAAVSKTPTKFKSTKERSSSKTRHPPPVALATIGELKRETNIATASGTVSSMLHQLGSKSTGATPSHFAAAAGVVGRCTLAKGPDAKLRHGSDPNLRIGASRAVGADPTLRRGPNPQLRQGFISGGDRNVETTAVAVR